MPRIDIQVPRFVRWRLIFLVAMVLGLAAENYPRPGFWSSYVLKLILSKVIPSGFNATREQPRFSIWDGDLAHIAMGHHQLTSV
jgi:hypothetical protein